MIADFNRSEGDKIVLGDNATNVWFANLDRGDVNIRVVYDAAKNGDVYAILIGTHTLVSGDFESAGGAVNVTKITSATPTTTTQPGGSGRTSGAFDVGDVIKAGETVQFTGSGFDGTIAYDGSGFSINLMVGNSRISFDRSSASIGSGSELNVSGIKFSHDGQLKALPDGVTAKFVPSAGGANSELSPTEDAPLDFDILGEVPGDSMVPDITADII